MNTYSNSVHTRQKKKKSSCLIAFHNGVKVVKVNYRYW